jgi:hypothetical protein
LWLTAASDDPHQRTAGRPRLRGSLSAPSARAQQQQDVVAEGVDLPTLHGAPERGKSRTPVTFTATVTMPDYSSRHPSIVDTGSVLFTIDGQNVASVPSIRPARRPSPRTP